MTTMSEIVSLYLTYRTKKAEIKLKQRDELKTLLKPYAVDLGRAFDEQRKVVRVEDIAAAIGTKNRNLVYQMIAIANADKNIAPATAKPIAKSSEPQPEYEYRLVQQGQNTDLYEITLFPQGVTYEVDYGHRNATVEIPNEILTLPKDERDKFKRAVGQIERVYTT